MKFFKYIVLSFLIFSVTQVSAQAVKYKCMIQMTNYTGEGAYIAISLMNKNGSYNKTLYVLGPDKKWHPDWKEWHKAFKAKKPNLSGITGASVSGGDRTVVTLNLDKSLINAGYTLRFETAVEEKGYFAKDVEIPLTTDGLAAKADGKGYIRYVRFSSN